MLLALCLVLAPGPAGAPRPVPARIACTETTVSVDGGPAQRSLHPIVEALERAGPGTLVTLAVGTYEPFTIGFDNEAWNNARTEGGRPGLPILVEGRGVRIRGREGDAIAVDQSLRNGYITFRGLVIEAGQRAGIMFYKQPPGRVHAGYSFEDCDVVGGYDHLKGKGKNTKWGVWGHQLRDFRFVGVTRPAHVQGIRREHGFYVQNPSGTILIENVRASGLGRTFCQFTARAGDGPAGNASITVRRCDVRDVGVSRDDGYKGGAAFTVAGRLGGTLLFEDNVFRAGFDERWQRLTTAGQPYGTGAFVAWQGREAAPNGTLILRGNDFRFAPGCGDRPVVAIGGCRRVEVGAGNRFESGGAQPALALDPVDLSGRPVSPPNGEVRVAADNRFVGAVSVRGEELDEQGLRALAGGR